MDRRYLCQLYIVLVLLLHELTGLSSQNVTITEDTVYIMNNVVGQVKCTLYGNCGAISWYLLDETDPLASAFVGYSCQNTTNGFYQTCDDQNHQYTLYFTGTTNLHGQTIRCSGEGCIQQKAVSDTVSISIIVSVSSVTLEGTSGQQITVTAGQSKSITCVTGSSRPAPRVLWYIGMTNMTQSSTETQIPSQELFYTKSNITFIPTKSHNGLKINCKAYNTDNNTVELTSKPKLNVQYPPYDLNAVIKNGNTISTIEGNSTTLFCEVRGGNPLATITWDCFRLSGTSSADGEISRSTINFIAHRSYNRRTCTCRATHLAVNLGSDYVTFHVYYAAAVTRMVINNGNNFTIPEHSTKTITCLAEGLPQPSITLRYISNNTIIKSVNGLRLDFSFPLARCEDTGIYKCDAINKFISSQLLQKEVFVLCQPRAAKEPLQNRYALSVGKTLNITVPYLAYPRPTFQWFKNDSSGSLIQITDGEDDVQINNFAINTFTYVTQLIRRNLKENDFGTYILSSSNIIGPKEDVYIVGAKGVNDSGAFSAVGASIGSAIVIIIIVVIVIFVVRRFKGELTKGKKDVETNGRSALSFDDDQKGPGTSSEAQTDTSDCAIGGQNDYPYAEVKNNGKSGFDNPVPVYAEVQKNPKKDKKPDPFQVYVDKSAKPMKRKGKVEKENQVSGGLYDNVENVNKGNVAAADPALVIKQNQTKPAKPPKVPKRNKDGLIYIDLDLEERVAKPRQDMVIIGLEGRTDYAEIDITRRGDPLPPDDKPQ